MIGAHFGRPASCVGSHRRDTLAFPDETIARLAGALQENTPLDRTIRSYAGDAAREVRNALVRGLALGDSADMTTRVIAALGVTRARAAALVRTEMLRASRGAAIAAYKESGVVAGWRWSASLSDRTCPACLSLSGEVFSLDTPMASHVNCRCAAVPWSPKWHEPWQAGDDWLKGQDIETQETVLGVQGAADFRAGNLRLRDFRQLTRDAKWGDSYQPRGVEYARKAAGKAGRAPEQWADAPERKTGQGSKATDTTLTTISEKSAGTGGHAIPRETHPLNPAVRKDANGIWGGDELPVMEWEAAEARVVLSPGMQERLQFESPVLRWATRKYTLVASVHSRDSHVIADLSGYLERWQYLGREANNPSTRRVMLQDEQGRWYAVTLGSLLGSENVVTVTGSSRTNFLRNRLTGMAGVVERGE